ncbi:MAG: fibronectin type III domain-containing protein [Bacteroidota bacterium]|nr:fibronectin type III domain-containing protein [Bacteroidota bacterium]
MSCQSPQGLAASEIKANSALLKWYEVQGAVQYKIAYRLLGSVQWEFSGSMINNRAMYGLQPSSTYEFKLQVVCNSTDASDYSSPVTFSTLSLCSSAPLEKYVIINEIGKAVLSWSNVGNNVTYNVEYKILGAANWIQNLSTENHLEIQNLTPGASYVFKVQTICNSESSNFSKDHIFLMPDSFENETFITVDPISVLNEFTDKPLGINMNYLLDNDDYLKPIKSTQENLKNLGVKYLRFPGGEKADSYWWATPPYSQANHKLARTGPFEWPAYDFNFVEQDFTTLKDHTLNFDQFIEISKSINAEPIIVLSYTGMFKDPTPGGTKPGREEAFVSAEAWVRYSNIINNYGIKYWMIGN